MLRESKIPKMKMYISCGISCQTAILVHIGALLRYALGHQAFHQS